MVRRIALVLLLLFACIGAHAEYPDRPIRLIVAWPPGGVTDVVARHVATQLATTLGQPVTVDNRAGANGIIGTQAAVSAPADGYTLLAVTAETHAINPYVYPKLGYSPLGSFETLGQVAQVSFVLAAREDLEANDVQQLLAIARSKPEQINAGSYGVGSTSHLGLALLEKSAGVRFKHVPYQGVTPTVNALLAKQIDVAFVNGFNVVQFVPGKRLKVLGTASARPLAILPEVPTLDSQGLKGFEAGNWYGYMAPKGIPAKARAKLAAAIEKIARSEDFKTRVDSMGVEVLYRNPDQFTAFLAQENARLSRVVRERGISVNQ